MGIMISPELLRRMPLFTGLGDDMIKAFAMLGEVCAVREGTRLFHEGDKADAFYVIMEGELELMLILGPQAANKVSVTRLGPGELLGWSALLEPYVYHLGCVAVKNSKLVKFHGANTCELMAHNPAVGYKLMSRISQVIGSRLHHLRLQFISMIEGERWQSFSGRSSIYISEGGKTTPSE